MGEDVTAAALAQLEWERNRRHAAMDVARSRADAAERRDAEQEAERRAQEKPAADPDMQAFMARMNGAPGPLTLAETLVKHQMMAPPEDSAMRDPGAEYGSPQNPARWFGDSFTEVPAPAVQRSRAGEYEMDRLINRADDMHRSLIEAEAGRDYEGQLAAARAKSAAGRTVSRSAGGPERAAWQDSYCRGCGALSQSWHCRGVISR